MILGGRGLGYDTLSQVTSMQECFQQTPLAKMQNYLKHFETNTFCPFNHCSCSRLFGEPSGFQFFASNWIARIGAADPQQVPVFFWPPFAVHECFLKPIKAEEIPKQSIHWSNQWRPQSSGTRGPRLQCTWDAYWALLDIYAFTLKSPWKAVSQAHWIKPPKWFEDPGFVWGNRWLEAGEVPVKVMLLGLGAGYPTVSRQTQAQHRPYISQIGSGVNFGCQQLGPTPNVGWSTCISINEWFHQLMFGKCHERSHVFDWATGWSNDSSPQENQMDARVSCALKGGLAIGSIGPLLKTSPLQSSHLLVFYHKMLINECNISNISNISLQF